MRHILCSVVSLVLASTGLRHAFAASPSHSAVSAAIPTTSALQRVSLDGIINSDTDDTLAFTPDRSTVFFDRSEGSHKTILVSHRVNGRWSQPQTASFSGIWFDQDPIVAPDGSYVLFNSDRPITANGRPLTQTYFGKIAAPGSNIWRVERRGADWGTPRWIGPNINNNVFIDFASIANDNTLYFMRWDAANKVMQLWRARYKGSGVYEDPERVSLGDPSVSIHDPAISGDQSFIVFDYGKVAGGLGRLCIAFYAGGSWSAPIDFGDTINKDLPWGAHLDPDGHTVYVTGRSGIWQLNLAPWMK